LDVGRGVVAFNSPAVCAGCEKVYVRQSYEEPPGWLIITVHGPRYRPFQQWYICSRECVDKALARVKGFALSNLEVAVMQDETIKSRIIRLLSQGYTRSQLIKDCKFAERTVDAAIKEYKKGQLSEDEKTVVKRLTYQEFLKICCAPRDTPLYSDIFVRLGMAEVIEPEGELPPEHKVFPPAVQVTPFQMLEERMRQMELRLARLEKLSTKNKKKASRKGGGSDATTDN